LPSPEQTGKMHGKILSTRVYHVFAYNPVKRHIMNYEIKNLPKSTVEVTVKLAEDAMKKHMKRASDEISKNVKIKGFRPGHVPPHVLEQHVDKKMIVQRAQEFAIQQSYSEIVVKEKIQVAARPRIKIEKDEPLEFTATVAVVPEVEIKDYKSIKVKKKEAKVEKSDLKQIEEDLKKYGSTYKDVDRAAKKGDRAEVDFEGFDEEGKAVANTASKNHPVVLGEESLIPGFEKEIIGMKKDEEKEFKITFPKDYTKEDFQNKKMKFKVKLNRLEEATEPEMNDALIEKVIGKKQTFAEFMKEAETNILARKQTEAKQKCESEYVEALVKKMKIEISDDLIEQEAYQILHDMKEDIEKRGQKWADFIEKAKTNNEDLLKKYSGEAERRIKVRLALQYVIKEEGVKVDEKDMKAELDKIKGMYPDTEADKVQKDFDDGPLKNQIANRLSLQRLFDKVLS
jgi:trigger factor